MINYAGLGYSEAHEKMEDRLVIPRYLRCVLGLMTDALQGRIRGNEARRVIATAAATVLAPTVYLLS